MAAPTVADSSPLVCVETGDVELYQLSINHWVVLAPTARIPWRAAVWQHLPGSRQDWVTEWSSFDGDLRVDITR